MPHRRLWLVAGVTVVVAIAAAYQHDRAIRTRVLLPVAFEHLDHTPITCVTCHHNYEDDTGFDSCYSCHKTDETVAASIETMFHDLCRGCHIEKAHRGEHSGPFRSCRECHNETGRMSQNLKIRKH